MNPFSLRGKSVLVTGASSGIGRATAVMCSEMGAMVVASGRNPDKLDETLKLLKEPFIGICGDLRSDDDIDRIATDCPKLDGVVHSAGMGHKMLVRSLQKNDIQEVMETNFNATVLLQKALMKKKRIADGGSVVFIASRAPFSPSVGNSIYAASKGALLAFAKVLSLELAGKGIRVNSICPAMVWTDLVRKEQELTGVDYHELEKEYPLKRYGQPEDVAALAVYMLSDASKWMTGSAVDITGGSIRS